MSKSDRIGSAIGGFFMFIIMGAMTAAIVTHGILGVPPAAAVAWLSQYVLPTLAWVGAIFTGLIASFGLFCVFAAALNLK